MTNAELVLRIKEAFQYNPLTGEVSWLASRPREHFKGQKAYQHFLNNRAGKPVKASTSAYGYFVVGLGNKVLLLHRIAFVLSTGAFPKETIDHIDGNRKNNCWDNLREVTQAVNTRNQKINSRNSSGVAGVYWSKRDKKWISQGCLTGKPQYLGAFSTIEEAQDARIAFLNNNPTLGYSKDHGQRLGDTP